MLGELKIHVNLLIYSTEQFYINLCFKSFTVMQISIATAFELNQLKGFDWIIMSDVLTKRKVQIRLYLGIFAHLDLWSIMILPTNSGHGTKRVNSQSEVAHMTKSASINKSHANNTRLNFVKKPLSLPNVSVWPLPPVNSAFTIPSSTNNCTRQYPLRESAQAAEIACLKRQLAERDNELAILQKGATYFA